MTDDRMAGPFGTATATRAGSSRQTVNNVIEAGLLDDLMGRAGAGGTYLIEW